VVQSVIVQDRTHIGEGRIEIAGFVLAHVDEDQAVKNADMAGQQTVFRLVEIRWHQPGGYQPPIQPKGPGVIRTNKARRVAAFRLTYGRPAVAADVEKRAHAVCILADDDNLFGTDTEQEIIALVRDARNMASQNPFAGYYPIEIGFKH
jgi:hypothetical protein